jgi:hypothetical protein
MTNEITVKICQADTPNKNNRLYSSEVLQSAIEKVATKEILSRGGIQHSQNFED